jgi:hypothetical protein
MEPAEVGQWMIISLHGQPATQDFSSPHVGRHEDFFVGGDAFGN